MAWPRLPEEWGDHYEQARNELLELARAIAIEGGETLRLLVANESDLAIVEERAGAEVRAGLLVAELGEFGDAWTRDTFPFFLDHAEETRAAIFRFDGWGGRYLMPGDDSVGGDVARRLELRSHEHDLVLEGGALEVDGEGVGLTTEDSLFVRNAARDREETELVVREALGLRLLLNLHGALLNDHTDGHIDTLARFAPGPALVVMHASEGDPNADVLESIHEQSRCMITAHDLHHRMHSIPSPGLVPDDDGAPLPASYLNFYIANRAVLVPAYGVAADEDARAALEPLFPGRKVVSIPARHILTGGGAIHCVTHQQPVLRRTHD